MKKLEIEKRLEEIEDHIFLIEMIDRWTTEDDKCFCRLVEERNDLLSQLERLVSNAN